MEEGERIVAWTKVPPNTLWPHPSNSHFSKLQNRRMSDIGRNNSAAPPGSDQKILKPQKALGDHGAHPHFTDVATEDQKREGTCPRPYSWDWNPASEVPHTPLVMCSPLSPDHGVGAPHSHKP